jgi:hypothetical protein
MKYIGLHRDVARPTTTTQLKMEDACILSKVIEKFWWKKKIQKKKMRAFLPF